MRGEKVSENDSYFLLVLYFFVLLLNMLTCYEGTGDHGEAAEGEGEGGGPPDNNNNDDDDNDMLVIMMMMINNDNDDNEHLRPSQLMPQMEARSAGSSIKAAIMKER